MTARRSGLVLALAGLRAEGDLVRALSAPEAPATVARRVTEIVGLLATCRAGLADGALVSPWFPGLDRAVVQGIRDAGLPCWGVVEPNDDEGRQRLRDWGVPAGVLAGDLGAMMAALLADCGPSARPARDRAGRSPVIVVTGPAGAPGRSTVALNVAAECSRPALLIDGDVVAPSLAFALDLSDAAGGLLAACRAARQGMLTTAGLRDLAQPVGEGLRVVSGVADPHRLNELDGGGSADLWQLVATCAGPIVVDAGAFPVVPPDLADVQEGALACATHVVVVANPTALSIRRLMRGYADLTARTKAPVTLVWNRLPPARRGGALGRQPLQRLRPVCDALGAEIAVAGLPDDPRAAAAIDAASGPLARSAPRTGLRVALRTFTGQLLSAGAGAGVAVAGGARETGREATPRTRDKAPRNTGARGLAGPAARGLRH